METVAVIDFETTGLSPDSGGRATEIAAVLLEGGRVIDRCQSLMNAREPIPPFIEALTATSDAMIRRAQSVNRPRSARRLPHAAPACHILDGASGRVVDGRNTGKVEDERVVLRSTP